MDILIKNMDLSEERQIIITKKGEVLTTDWRGISMPTEATAIELRPHGDLIERDKAIDEMEYVSFDTAYNCELAQEVLRYNVPIFLEATE